VFGESDDGLPFIGACGDGGLPRAYYAVGYGGNGITFSLIAAHIIRDSFLNRDNPSARLFCFDR
jgi:glycine/D-amino acid oxidase-like deaminating enzyme